MGDRHRRILLVGDSLALGGTEGQFVDIACGLDRTRWDVHMSCLRAEGPLRVRLEAAGLRVWSCGASFRSPRFLTAVGRLARYLRANDIRLVHAFDFYSNILGIPAALLARVPVTIASQRDLGDLRPALQRRVNGVALRLADRVLVNSEAVAERFEHLGSRLIVIPNGVDAERFSPPATPKRFSDSVTIGTLANLRPEKGVADLVHAAALVAERFPQHRFVIWGQGPLRPDLEALVHSLGLSGTVQLRGATAEPEVALRQLDIFVLPSTSEACSNALLQAMATGLAVVATRVGGNPGLVEDESTGLLVPPRDPVALAKAIVRLVEDPARAAELAARARHRARDEFGLDRMLASMHAFYDRALDEVAG